MRAARLHTADGLALEAEWSAPAEPTATVVLCHPHPQYGGTMRSIVISSLFDALPRSDIACLRFNFRGVEQSEGAYDDGKSEPLDVVAAIDEAAVVFDTGPLILVGWSFGADMALTVLDERITAWVGIAPPLRFRGSAEYDAVGHDERPKLLELAANDEFRAPEELGRDTKAWVNTRTEVIAGASHFFVGRTDRVVDLTADFVRGI